MRFLFTMLCVIAGAVVSRDRAWSGEQPPPEKRVARFFRVPPDFSMHHSLREPAANPPSADAPADPFAASDPNFKPGPLRRYPHVIHALGSEPPIDAKPLLENLGIIFGKGDAALISTEDRTLLFVMAREDQVDLVETILDQMGGPGDVLHVQTSWLMRQTDAKGKAKDLLERSLIVRTGQRSGFERQCKGKTVEKAEVEVSVGEGDVVDLNADLHLQFKDLKVHASGQALIHDGDEPVALYTTAGSNPRSKLEVLVSARIMRDLPVDESYHHGPLPPSKLVDVVGAEVAALEASPPPAVLRSDAVPVDLGDLGKGTAAVEVKLPDGRMAQFADVTQAFGEFLPFKVEKGRVWYCHKERVLFLHAEERTIGAAYGMAVRQGLEGPGQFELKLSTTETKGKKERLFPPRTLLIRAGQEAKGACGREETWAQLSLNQDRTIADFTVNLTGAVFGNETWTFSCTALTSTDGRLPATLVSGRAVDSGGGFKRLQATVEHRGNHWQELLRHPVRRAAIISALEAALVTK